MDEKKEVNDTAKSLQDGGKLTVSQDAGKIGDIVGIAKDPTPDQKKNENVFATYELNANGLSVSVVVADIGSFVPEYRVSVAGLGEATRVLLMSFRQEMLNLVPIDPNRISDREYNKEMNLKYIRASSLVIDKYLPQTPPDKKVMLTSYIINMMLGLGDIEIPLADDNLEEVVINSSKEPIWVYHKTYGWCKTNITLRDEITIYNAAEQIGRKVGRQITNLSPLMDAELSDGSRVNATLFPVSQNGNTITIRKFSKNPWTMTRLIDEGSISKEMAALIWICVQNEISLILSGGTASGKTSFLNSISMFMPPNHRIISVEETRELSLPSFLHWVPMLTRQPNPEGKGQITLYDLMINALRQRPDVILVGEVRTKPDALTLFEAIHTGHAVYGTIHADNAQDTIIRLVNPPIDIPKLMLGAIGGVVSLFRHRRKGIRRVLEFGEVLKSGDINLLYRWNMRNDSFVQISEMTKLSETISLYGGYTRSELIDEIKERASVLDWMVKNKVFGLNTAGFVAAQYYNKRDKVLELVNSGVPYSEEAINRL